MANRRRRRRRGGSRRPARKMGLLGKLQMRFKNLFTPSGGIMAVILMLIPFLVAPVKAWFEKGADVIKEKTGLEKKVV